MSFQPTTKLEGIKELNKENNWIKENFVVNKVIENVNFYWESLEVSCKCILIFEIKYLIKSTL